MNAIHGGRDMKASVGTVAAAAVGMAASLAVGAPASASAVDLGPRLLGLAPAAVKAGTPTWVSAYWLSLQDVCDAQVTVTATDTSVVYPTNTATYTSFRKSAGLKALRTDYTAFRLDVAANRTKPLRLKLTMTYDKNCSGDMKTQTATATVAVVKNR